MNLPALRATLADVRHLAVIAVWHPTHPNAADVLGISRTLAYAMAARGDLPTLRLGSRVVVPVPALLAMLGESQSPVLIADRAETAGQSVSGESLPPAPITLGSR